MRCWNHEKHQYSLHCDHDSLQNRRLSSPDIFCHLVTFFGLYFNVTEACWAYVSLSTVFLFLRWNTFQYFRQESDLR